MNSYEQIDKEKLRETLNANWMTHDGLWFAHCLKEVGIEKTNNINRAAVREMAKIEAKRLKKLLGIKTVANGEELERFFQAGFQIIKGSFMNFDMSFPRANTMIWKIPRCFAYEGVKRQGIADQYQCGIVERVYGWLEALGVEYEIHPKPEGCNMVSFQKCEMEIAFKITHEQRVL